MVLAEPHGPAGAALARNAIRLAGRDLGPAANLDSGQPRQHGAGTLSLPILAHRLVAAADPAPFETGPVSTPVAAALTYLDGALGGHPRLTEAARLAAVSPSRLTHLFSEEIGIPFRRYVLWLRLRRAAEAASSAATLTDAAMVAGFADLPHLSRVCRSMFGVNPSVVQNMQFIPTTG